MINKLDSLGDSTIFMISLIFSFEIVNVDIPRPKILFWIAASVADAAAVNLNASLNTNQFLVMVLA